MFQTLIIISNLLFISCQQSFSNVCQSGIREDNTNYIYCARRSLNEIPLFSKNNVVYDELVLSDNRITELNAASFARIKVKKIFLNGNPIRKIDQMTFAKLENHLEELWLDAESPLNSQQQSLEPIYDDLVIVNAASSMNNDQQQQQLGLPKAIINYLRNLNTLKLKNFQVKKLENYIFKRLNRIEHLSLQFCSIEQIEKHAFDSGIKNSLKELYLDGNRLETVPSDALLTAQFKQLKVLSLAQNMIKQISSDNFMQNLNLHGNFHIYQDNSENNNNNKLSLVKLDLSYNGLKSIDARAFETFNSSLETLLLQNNEINSYNMKFVQSLSNLRELNLDFNLIAKLSSNLFANSARMQFLSMQGNSVQFSSEFSSSSNENELIFNGLIELQRLNLARNGIKSLGENLFKPMRQLKSLIMDKNPSLELHEHTFNGLYESLVNISLQNTKIKDISCLKQFEKLERVKLSNNELQTLSLNTFSQSSKTLANLDMQNNQLSLIADLNEQNLVFDNLLELDLSNNKFCTLNPKLFNKILTPKLRNLGLSQNPLVCDCYLLPLYEWVKIKLDKDAFSYIQWQCETSSSAKRIKFNTLSSNDFVCNSLNKNSKCNQVQTISTQLTTTTTSSTTSSNSKTTLPKITSLELTSSQNSVLLSWSMDADSKNLIGFKLNYNKLGNNSSSVKTFLIDRLERKFKLDNLDYGTKYTICLSYLMQGVTNNNEKYCREILIESIETNSAPLSLEDDDDNIFVQPSTYPSSSLTTQSASISASASASDYILLNQNVSNNHQSTVLSTLMISLLIILIFFICALVAFLYVYVKKCRLTQKKLNHHGNMGSLSSISRKNYLSGVLYPTVGPTVNNHMATIDPRKIIIASDCNGQRLLAVQNGNLLISAAAAQQKLCDNSTVSSTLSSQNQNNPLINGDANDSSTPTSFTHYLVQQPNSSSSIEQPYIAYDYNLGGATLIIPSSQQLAFLNSNQFNNNSNNNQNPDHVYCEIPSTISRSYRTTNNQVKNLHNLLVLNENQQKNLLTFNQNAIMLNGNLMTLNHHHLLKNNANSNSNNNNNNQQNSSSSLLLSTSSSSSNSTSNHSSPQSNSTTNTKYTNASII
jgi:Leucine-rich repeat (LRR) protein